MEIEYRPAGGSGWPTATVLIVLIFCVASCSIVQNLPTPAACRVAQPLIRP